ncbi:hypothetical protein LEP1GSC016_2683 [Leptospira borgpetersenii serovar Hardjo-bovis str. Sponselee]|uniref:Uncharacterized protein n=5 Tax=Leptospira borgpetersenii TaxID=174 RepID=M6C0B8_LEPBO|nr:hypothetical protein LEP1GSC128_3785 [Leptospira borgpetersenii str. 200801926]EKQ93781.1 hypothetical protein LEP1GSC101_1874 [Leptospira borgpetersenii str. UI 09149]EMJ82103.1 hypothetical protein LEP1GSC016_2683 [Leptospira borgpetersenii serovar Hardjo-bovis str. Sponselee]EMK10627.1 hypothetical protein LEP1GSC066_2387 [Leptospira sp. serovar Kenya str. Sh9]EMN13549.1 hypothetical protein LEP1GSC055_0576 [Leptospira borgpetersenii str. Brem 307]EMN16851.1 hypothetical protein LEP1GSC0
MFKLHRDIYAPLLRKSGAMEFLNLTFYRRIQKNRKNFMSSGQSLSR